LLPHQQATVPPEPEYKTETVTKNYLVHELAQHRGASRPTWGDNMRAMFGDHVKWEELKVFVGKNRPLCKWCQISYTLVLMRLYDSSTSTANLSHHWSPS
jgi:hypothetical protein